MPKRHQFDPFAATDQFKRQQPNAAPSKADVSDEPVETVQFGGQDHDTTPPGDLDQLPTGTMVGDYKILEVRGQGGMGVVYKAKDVQLNRLVALKTLRREANELTTGRSQREASLLAQLEDPRIVPVYGLVERDGSQFMVMQWLEGRDVGEVLESENGPLPWRKAFSIAAETARALITAHRKNIVHRDIKPGNIFLVPDEGAENGIKVVVTDFGLAKPVVDPEEITGDHFSVFTTGNLRDKDPSVGICGTPGLMAPEQWRGEAADSRTDIYLLGGTLFWLLTGRPPFSGNVMSMNKAHCEGERPDPLRINPTLPAGSTEVIAKAMQIDPSDRYATAAEMLKALEKVMANPAPRKPISALVVTVVTSILLLAGGLCWIFVFSPNTPSEKLSEGLTTISIPADNTDPPANPQTAIPQTPKEEFIAAMASSNPSCNPDSLQLTLGTEGQVEEIWIDASEIDDLSPLRKLQELQCLRIINWKDGLDLSVVEQLPRLTEFWTDRDPPRITRVTVRAILQP